MNPYIQKLAAYEPNCDDKDIHTILDALFYVYQDLNPTDSEEIKACFSRLNDILGKLPLRECDKVWNLTCQLCTEHARSAFQTGVQVGAKLITELGND